MLTTASCWSWTQQVVTHKQALDPLLLYKQYSCAASERIALSQTEHRHQKKVPIPMHCRMPISNACHFHVTGCVLFHIYCKISLKPQARGVVARADLFAWKVLFNQTSHWPLERKPNNSDDNEVPLATDKTQSLPALFVISNWTECGGNRNELKWNEIKKKDKLDTLLFAQTILLIGLLHIVL